MLYTQIRAFEAVARIGSFVGAADALGLSQPALSIQVRALEAAYGVVLFQRRGRSIRLTRAGRELFELSRQFMRLEEEISAMLQTGCRLDDSRLKLAFDGPHITMPILARFRERYPGVQVAVTMGNTRAVRQLLLDQQVDIAILPRMSDDPRFYSLPLHRHQAVVLVGKGHRWSGRRRMSIFDLDGQPMVAREAGSNTQRCVDEGLNRLGIKPDIVLRLGSREAVKEAVAANLGFGIVWECEARGATDLHVIRLMESSIESTDFIACPKEEVRRWPIKAFFDIALGKG